MYDITNQNVADGITVSKQHEDTNEDSIIINDEPVSCSEFLQSLGINIMKKHSHFSTYQLQQVKTLSLLNGKDLKSYLAYPNTWFLYANRMKNA